MKKEVALLALVLLAAQACSAQEIMPETVNYADVIIETGASGEITGVLSAQDTLEVRFIIPAAQEGQEVEYLGETLVMGGETYNARNEDLNGVMYAVFEIPDMYKYEKTPRFEIKVRARVKRTASMGLGEDFILGKGGWGEEMAEFLEPTEFIESDANEIVDFTNSEFRGTSEIEAIRGITEWVNSNITYDRGYYGVKNGARETFEIRRGVCGEFANMAAALMRAKGIPVRYVSGVSYNGEEFNNHGWIEAYLPGTGWVGVDPTYGEAGYVDALHFPLAKSADVNDLSNITVATNTINSVKAKITLLAPKVSINEVRVFMGIVQASVRKDKGESMQDVGLAIEMKGLQKMNVIVPVELEMHRDFKIKGISKRLVWLKPGEWGTAEFIVVAPKFETMGAYGRYEFILLLPDGNISDYIEVYPEGGLSARVAPAPKMSAGDAAIQAVKALAIAGLVLIIAATSIFVLKDLLRK
ncbi:MAG: transglutaminase family protein [Candidatus Diapherotrites archaeon]